MTGKKQDCIIVLNRTIQRRIQSTINKKHVEIVLSDQAEPIIEAGLEAQRQFAKNVLHGLSEEEKNMCMTVFSKICDNAEQCLKGNIKSE